MKNFLIGGTIISDDGERYAQDDVTPSQIAYFIRNLDKGEPFTLSITSPGGSVTAGIAIANLIRQASKDGHRCTARIIGVAASMASVIACAADEIEMDESAFMMIHNPWTVAQGDANELRKSADVLDQMRAAILSFYRSKFAKTDDELIALMDAETWFTGGEAESFGFKASIIASSEPLKAAACARKLPGFAKTPTLAEHLFVLGNQKESSMEEEVKSEAAKTPTEKPVEEAPVETVAATPAPEAPAPEVAPEVAPEAPAPEAEPKAEMTAVDAKAAIDAEVNARLAAAMKSRDERINDLSKQLDAKGEELTKAHAEVTRLTEALDQVSKELTDRSSACDAAQKALAELNARVLTPAAELPTMAEGLAKCANPAERSAFLASGKFRRK